VSTIFQKYIQINQRWQSFRRKVLDQVLQPMNGFFLLFSPDVMSHFSIFATLVGSVLLYFDFKLWGLLGIWLGWLGDALDGHMARLHYDKKQRTLNPYVDDISDTLKEIIVLVLFLLLLVTQKITLSIWFLIALGILLGFNMVVRYQRYSRFSQYFPAVPLYGLQVLCVTFIII